MIEHSRELLARLRSFFRKRERDEDFDAEIATHLEMLIQENRQRGMSPEGARRAALISIGGMEQAKELHRDNRSLPQLETFAQDIRYALRTMRNNPGFTSVAVLSLALGIGANTAIFSLIDALLLRSLPVRNPQELVQVQMTMPGAPTPSSFSYPLVRALSDQSEIFSGVCGFSNDVFDTGRREAPEPVTGTWLTGACHEMFGLVPVAGRLLTREDDRPGAPSVVVISDTYWESRFGRDPSVIGGQLAISGVAATVVGVSPRSFTGATIGEVSHIAVSIGSMARALPDRSSLLEASARWLQVLARPHHGVSREQITARLAVTWPSLVSVAIPDSMAASRRRQMTSTINVIPGGTGWSSLRLRFSQPLVVLMAVVALILLIACANIANLLLARATGRRREIAVRLAIGAGRTRLVRQLLTESILLSLSGAILAIALASFGSRFLVAMLSSGQESMIVLDLNPNWRVLGFITSMAFGTALAFGIVPALQATAIGPTHAITGTSVRITGSRSRLGAMLVTAQVALSLLLVIGAGLFLRTLQNLRSLDPGFRRDGVLLVEVNGRKLGYRGPQLTAFYHELLQEMEALPGVASASFSFTTPVGKGQVSQRIAVSGQSVPNEETLVNLIAPRFFETLHTPLIAGREFTPGDTATAQGVAIVNQAFVRRYFQGVQPLGQHLSIVGQANAGMQVVGVVQDAVYESLREPPPPTVYAPFSQRGGNSRAVFEIDTRGSLAQLVASVRARIQPKSPGSPIRIGTLTGQIESSLVQERLMAALAGCFGVLALLLAAIGLYGLLAYSVARRSSEMGIRMALGAERRQVLWMISRDAIKLLLGGVALGLPAALAASRLVSSMLFDLTPSDPATMLAATALLMFAGLLAALLPAYRASRVDPMVALRYE